MIDVEIIKEDVRSEYFCLRCISIRRCENNHFGGFWACDLIEPLFFEISFQFWSSNLASQMSAVNDKMELVEVWSCVNYPPKTVMNIFKANATLEVN